MTHHWVEFVKVVDDLLNLSYGFALCVCQSFDIFFGCWNDYTGPLMYVADKQESWTLSLALYKDFGIKQGTSNNTLANAQMAVGVMMMIPCVILFAFFQKELMEGIAAIGIKG